MRLGSENLMHLLQGASFFACGGGVSVASSAQVIGRLGAGRCVNVKAFEEFKPNDLVCTVYAIGAAGAARKDYSALVGAFDALEMLLGEKISGVIPGEIGSEINAIWVALERDIALVDSDMVGGRAVPEEQMDIHSILGITTAPTIVVNDKGDLFIVKSAKNPAVLESVYRSFAVASGGYCYIAGRPMRAVDAGSVLPRKTISNAHRLGARLSKCRSESDLMKAVEELTSSVMLAIGTISEIEEEIRQGFLAGNVVIHGSGDYSERSFQLYYRNENIILQEGATCMCSVPDLITIVDAKTLRPIHAADLRTGVEVFVFGSPALPFWKTEKAMSVMGPKYFGFDFNFVPLPKPVYQKI